MIPPLDAQMVRNGPSAIHTARPGESYRKTGCILLGRVDQHGDELFSMWDLDLLNVNTMVFERGTILADVVKGVPAVWADLPIRRASGQPCM